MDAKRRSTESSERKTEKKKQGVTREENSRQVLFDIQRANSERVGVYTQRVHPYPFRTRKLSSAVATILHGRLCGKIAQCRHGQRGKVKLPSQSPKERHSGRKTEMLIENRIREETKQIVRLEENESDPEKIGRFFRKIEGNNFVNRARGNLAWRTEERRSVSFRG